MRLELTGRHVEITPALRTLVDRKLGKLDRLLNDAAVSAQVVLTREKHRHLAESHAARARRPHARTATARRHVGRRRSAARSRRSRSRRSKVKGKWEERKRQRTPARRRLPAAAPADAAPPSARPRRASCARRATPSSRCRSTTPRSRSTAAPTAFLRLPQRRHRRGQRAVPAARTATSGSIEPRARRPDAPRRGWPPSPAVTVGALLGARGRGARPARSRCSPARRASTASSPARTSRRPASRSPGFDEYLHAGPRAHLRRERDPLSREPATPAERARRCRRALAHDFPCVLITGGFAPPPELVADARARAACRCCDTRARRRRAIAKLTALLEDSLAERDDHARAC